MTDVTKLARVMANECVAHRVRQASRVLTRSYDEALLPVGLQFSQCSVLVAIASVGKDGASLGNIADALVMDQTTLSRNVSPLVKANLLSIVRHPEDGRSKVVLLTPAGERLLEKAYPLWKAAQRKVQRALGATRFAALHAELAAVVSGPPRTRAPRRAR